MDIFSIAFFAIGYLYIARRVSVLRQYRDIGTYSRFKMHFSLVMRDPADVAMKFPGTFDETLLEKRRIAMKMR